MPVSNVLFRNSDGDPEVSPSAVTTTADLIGGDVEGVHYELFVADGAIAKGDIVHFTAGKVKTWSDLTQLHRVVGMAAAAAVDGANVKILRDQNKISGILTGATVDQRQFWNGSGFQSSTVTGSGKYQVQAGVARTATDLWVDVQIVDKNS